jgi:hypothetical protein
LTKPLNLRPSSGTREAIQKTQSMQVKKVGSFKDIAPIYVEDVENDNSKQVIISAEVVNNSVVKDNVLQPKQ